jgi:hypothetical protein
MPPRFTFGVPPHRRFCFDCLPSRVAAARERGFLETNPSWIDDLNCHLSLPITKDA